MQLKFKPQYQVGYKVKIAANTLAQIVGRGVSAVSTFTITILVARYFGVEAYGDFIKITTFIAFFYIFADFGLNAITIKELGQLESHAQTVHHRPIKTLLTTRFILGIGITWLAMALTVFLPFSTETQEGFSRMVKLGIIIFAPTIFLQAMIRSSNALFQFKLRYDKATIAIIAGSIVALILIAVIVYLRLNSILLVIVALLASSATTTFVSYLFFSRILTTQSVLSLNLQKIRVLLQKSFPLGLTLVLNIAFFRLDTFLLAIFRPTTEVGLYGLAYKFFEFPLTFPVFFMNALYPIMTRIVERKQEKIQLNKIIKQSALFLGISSVFLTIVLWLFAPLITLIKADFSGSVELFRILALWLPFFFLSSLLMWITIAKKRYWQLAGIYGSGLLLNLILNLILIPPYGAIAATYTTGVTELVILLLLTIQVIQ